VCHVLRLVGFEAEVALSSRAALAMLDKRMPRLLLAECYLHGLTGVQLGEHVRRIDRMVPVILMSGFSQDIAAPRKTHQAFLQKPFRAETLVLAVRHLLGAPLFLRAPVAQKLH
jgi:DNA-binding NtrC family response regulator